MLLDVVLDVTHKPLNLLVSNTDTECRDGIGQPYSMKVHKISALYTSSAGLALVSVPLQAV